MSDPLVEHREDSPPVTKNPVATRPGICFNRLDCLSYRVRIVYARTAPGPGPSLFRYVVAPQNSNRDSADVRPLSQVAGHPQGPAPADALPVARRVPDRGRPGGDRGGRHPADHARARLP